MRHHQPPGYPAKVTVAARRLLAAALLTASCHHSAPPPVAEPPASVEHAPRTDLAPGAQPEPRPADEVAASGPSVEVIADNPASGELEELAQPRARGRHQSPRLAGVMVDPVQEEVLDHIRTHIRSIQRCYETMLRRDGQLEGQLVLEITVAESGDVVARVISDEVGDPALVRCIERVMSQQDMAPRPGQGEVVFRYPLIFAP